MVNIELGNVKNEEQAKRIKAVLEGKTISNFKVDYGYNMNNWPVSVWTEYEGAEENEVKEMVMFTLACAL